MFPEPQKILIIFCDDTPQPAIKRIDGAYVPMNKLGRFRGRKISGEAADNILMKFGFGSGMSNLVAFLMKWAAACFSIHHNSLLDKFPKIFRRTLAMFFIFVQAEGVRKTYVLLLRRKENAYDIPRLLSYRWA